MIDYVETTIALQTGKKKLDDLLLKKKFEEATDAADEMIIALVDLKWWLRNQNDNHK
jgi:hypothetical protein